MIFSAKINAAPNGKFFYEVGHFDAESKWTPSIISGSIYANEQQAEDAAHVYIRRAEEVLRMNRRRHYQRDYENQTHGRAG